MTRTTLVTGARGIERETAIAAAFDPTQTTMVILEGLPDSASPLNTPDLSGIRVIRIAPGCVCCSGNLVMRVTLDRTLRHPPAQLYIGLASATHLQQIRAFLSSAPYDALITLTDDLQV
jgi:hypothetical protein